MIVIFDKHDFSKYVLSWRVAEGDWEYFLWPICDESPTRQIILKFRHVENISHFRIFTKLIITHKQLNK